MRIERDCWLITKPIAHRGLWGGNIIENSLTAYKRAIEEGFPIEIDLFLSTDGVLMSFHDDDLYRMTGVKGKIYEKDYEFLRSLSLLSSNERIPTFDQVLSLVDGKVPLLIEIKNQPNKMVVDKIVERLKSYRGDFAIQSFNPLYIKKVKKLEPKFLRGILATKTFADNKSKFINYVIKNMPLNFIIKPDFISYSYQDLPLKKRKRKNLPLLAWTVTDNETYKNLVGLCDNVIFENFIPE